MIKNILFDFDGVILNSMKIKADGFIELFKVYEIKEVKLLEEYHYSNGGISRFDKIRYFYKHILHKNISESKVLSLSEQFASIIESKLYDKKNLIIDSVEYIKKNYQQYNLHIVSGAEHMELNSLCNYFDLDKYFITIEGSPTKKDILVKNIIENFEYNKEETILIGDSINDYYAADKNNIEFFAYNNDDLKNYKYINSFREFKI